MDSQSVIRDILLGFVRRGEKIKLCIIHLFIQRSKLNEYEVKDLLASYYPVRLYRLDQVLMELKNEGVLVYESGKLQLTDSESFSKIFDDYRFLIVPFLAKEVWGRRDVVRTLEERYIYLIQRILMRGGTVARETLLSDIAAEASLQRLPSYYNYPNFDNTARCVENDLSELCKTGYLNTTPQGYHIPDFVMYDFLGDTVKAGEILSELSKSLWMNFEFEPYLSTTRQLSNKYPKIANSISTAVDKFRTASYNDALDSLNAAVQELSAEICRKLFDPEKIPSSLHARIVEIWRLQSLFKDDPQRSEIGVNAGVFLSSTLYVPKWIRDKTSHPLVRPTGDSVRLALACMLIAIDVARTLKLLEE